MSTGPFRQTPLDPPPAGYTAEVRAAEEEFFRSLRPDVGRAADQSAWETAEGLERLREINKRHGVTPDDPRVYSIAAFKADFEATLEEADALGRADTGHFGGLPLRRAAMVADCQARHFPGLYPGWGTRPYFPGPNRLAKLWKYTRDQCTIQYSLSSYKLPRFDHAAAGKEVLHGLYATLSRFDLGALVPLVPWPTLSEQETVGELNRIRSELEEMERRANEAAVRSEGRADPAAGDGWVGCSQADLWRANDVGKRAWYAESLREKGHLTKIKRKSAKGEITHVVFADNPEGRELKEKVARLKAEAGGRRRKRKG